MRSARVAQEEIVVRDCVRHTFSILLQKANHLTESVREKRPACMRSDLSWATNSLPRIPSPAEFIPIGIRVSNFSEKVVFIWSVADLLRGPYKPAQYGRASCGPLRVILESVRLCS